MERGNVRFDEMSVLEGQAGCKRAALHPLDPISGLGCCDVHGTVRLSLILLLLAKRTILGRGAGS